MRKFNIYCDESCHLENDHQTAMVIGAVKCPAELTPSISDRIKLLKEQHSLSRHFEIKWTKVSPAKASFYADLVDLFFDSPDLTYRAIVVPNKSRLDHAAFNQTHDEWYYKLFFRLLQRILNREDRHKIFLDIKDTRGAERIAKLKNYLSNDQHDFDGEMIETIANIRSHESQILQTCDLLTGALSHNARGFTSSNAKSSLVQRIKERSGYDLRSSTPPSEGKFNFLIWRGAE